MERTVVMLHGFTHTGASWDAVVRTLAAERYSAIAPDVRGHGMASELAPVELDAVIDDVDRVAERQRFTLVGYSMGGRIAVHVALALRARIERLVLIGASPGIADDDERERRVEADEELARWIEREPSIELVARRWEQTPILQGQPPEVAAFVHEQRLRNTPAGLARALRGLGTAALPSAWERLGALDMPVVLVVGQRDRKFTAIAERMAGLLPCSEIVVVPGVGHAVHLEAPEAIARVVRKPALCVASSARGGNITS
jgi:2-succinyl-6-hydroxy-2,4-cyclohexadiene-1-carboxylate synthase